MLLSAITPPQPVTAVYLTYMALAVVTWLVGFAVWRANPRRSMNFGAGLLLLGAGCWLMGFGLIFRFPADAAGFIRMTVACFGLIWPSGVFLLRRLVQGEETRGQTLRATAWAWGLGFVFCGLALSPLSIPYDSTWDSPRYGPLWLPLAGLEFVLTIAVVARLAWLMKSLQGVRRFEALFFLTGTSVVGFLMAVRFLIRAWTGRAFNPIEPGIMWIVFLCVMIYGIATKRLFRVRSLLLIIAGYGAVAVVGLGLLALCVVPGSGAGFVGVGRMLAGGLLLLVVWSFGGRLVGRWLDQRWRREVEPARRQLLRLKGEFSGEGGRTHSAADVVAEWARARHVRLVLPHDDGGWRDVDDPAVSLGQDDALVEHVRQHGWVTQDVLERSWRSLHVALAEQSLRLLDCEVAVMPAVERAGTPLLLCLGPRTDGALYSYDDVQNLTVLAETLGTRLLASGARIQAQKQGKVQAMEVLGASIGHDIKQHIAVLRMAAGRLAERPDDPKLKAEFLPLMEAELEDMLGYCRRLLSLAAPLPLQREVVDARTLLCDVVARVSELARARDVEVQVASAETDVLIEVDPERWREAVLNLIRNAIQAFPPFPREAAARVDLLLERAAGNAVLRVQDNGPGLPDAVLRRLFDPFVPTAKREGHGLGLYIAWDVAVKHDGDLRHQRPAKGGAEFVLSVPLAPSMATD